MTLSESTQRRCLSHGLIAGLIFFAGLALFLSSICPTLYWRDAAEFQVVAFELGVAHPAGSPFYTSLAKLFTFLPLGNIAFKVNLASAFFGALLLALTFLLIIECAQRLFPSLNRTFLLLSSTAAVVLYGVSESLWHNSIVAEVYTLQNCLIVWIGLLLVRSLRTDTKRCLYLAAFLFGLSSGAHIIMILYIPALILFLWLFHRTFLSPVHLAPLIMLVMLGASIYLYLPVRSSVDPHYDWGNPETLTNFVTHVTDRKDQGRHFAFYPERLPGRLKAYAGYYYEDFAVLGILLGLSGLFVFMKKNPRLFFSLALFFFSQWWFFIRYWPWSSAFLATFIFFTLLIAIGSCAFFTLLAGKRSAGSPGLTGIIPGVLLTGLAATTLLSGNIHWQNISRLDYWNPSTFFSQIYDCMQWNGLLITKVSFFGITYLQVCENYQPGCTILNYNDIMSPSLFCSLTPQRYPLIRIPEDLGPNPLVRVVEENVMEQYVYLEPNWNIVSQYGHGIEADGMVLRVNGPGTPDRCSSHHANILRTLLDKTKPRFLKYNDSEERSIIGYLFEDLGIFFYKRLHNYQQAVVHLSLAHKLSPETLNPINGLASSYLELNQLTPARHYVHKALALNPDDTSALLTLAEIHYRTRDYASAQGCYERVVQLNPEERAAYFGLGQAFTATGNQHSARTAFQQVLSLASSDDALSTKARKNLARLSSP
nr:DUF2723 domain-containing protein [Deltaproteobacteria bacterium]